MLKNIFENIEKHSKNGTQKKKIINYYISNGESTIADVAKDFDLSVPTVTKLIAELCEEGFIVDYGKIETAGGRRPNIYGINPLSGYFVGVDMKNDSLTIGVVNFKGEMIYTESNIPFEAHNTRESLEELCEKVKEFIDRSGVDKRKIGNVQFNISGRVNPKTGYSYSFFYLEERPLTELLSERLGYHVTIDNDTRAMTYGEYLTGEYTNFPNVLFVNVSWGLAVGMIIDHQLYYGKSGFSGEYGHANVFDNQILCHCGKKGCLETEASGSAIHRIFLERTGNGESSILSKRIEAGETISMEDIIEAVQKEDMLAIDIVEKVGHKLGKSMAALINLLNPDVVIIGGIMASAGDYLVLPFQSAVKKHSLNLVNNDSSVVLSKLKENAGVVGACLLSRHHFFENV